MTLRTACDTLSSAANQCLLIGPLSGINIRRPASPLGAPVAALFWPAQELQLTPSLAGNKEAAPCQEGPSGRAGTMTSVSPSWMLSHHERNGLGKRAGRRGLPSPKKPGYLLMTSSVGEETVVVMSDSNLGYEHLRKI